MVISNLFSSACAYDEIYGNILNDNDLKISHNPSVESMFNGGVFFKADHLLIVLWVSRIGSFPRSWPNDKNEISHAKLK